jgi:hypothetical protein
VANWNRSVSSQELEAIRDELIRDKEFVGEVIFHQKIMKVVENLLSSPRQVAKQQQHIQKTDVDHLIRENKEIKRERR